MIDTQSTSAGICCTWKVVDELRKDFEEGDDSYLEAKYEIEKHVTQKLFSPDCSILSRQV